MLKLSSLEEGLQLFNSDELGIGNVISLFQFLKDVEISVQVLVLWIFTLWPYKRTQIG